MRESKLYRYYNHQRAQGAGPISAFANLPRNFLQYYSRVHRSTGNEMTGYQHFTSPLLTSYSRSGTNWIRYIIEWISLRPTPGQVRLLYGSDFVVDRAHKGYEVMDKYSSSILVLRDYRECMIRHHLELWTKMQNVVDFVECDDAYQPPTWYVRNLQAFSEFNGPKLILYYEDLVEDPDGPIRELSRFLNLDGKRVDEFLSTLESRKSDSINAYERREHKSETRGSQDFSYHSKKNLSLEQAREFDTYFRQQYPDLFTDFLQRYAVSPEDADR